ncbi:MAG: cytochrome P460 family protein [Deferrisomatales bacterium]|nr:cytochrome P460 family protein [Deferrisomatales bacterium]
MKRRLAWLTVSLCAGVLAAGSAAWAGPEASGAALWKHLKAENYTSWKMWPGKSALYPGTEPHGVLLTTYVNGAALGAIEGKKGTMPAGAIVVKENYMPDKTLAAVTVMYKVQGYNPAGGDWFWAKYAPDGKVDEEGKEGMCLGCHSRVADNDYLFIGPLK